MLRSTATPLSSMARSIDSALMGSAPDWYAAPTSTMLAAEVSPNSCVDSSIGSRATTRRELAPIRPETSEAAG